jgi:subtilisin family serine protease
MTQAPLRLAACCAVLAGLAGGGTTLAAAQAPWATSLHRGDRMVPSQLIVRFRPGTSAADRVVTRRRLGATELRSLLVPRLHLVKVAEGRPVADAVRAFERDPNVQYAEPNYLRELASTTPNDALFPQLWGLNNTGQTVNGVAGTPDADIDAAEAWDTIKGSTGISVGVVDTGVAYNHPDLAANIWANPGETGGGKETNGFDDDGNGLVDDFRGYDFHDHDNNPIDDVHHGSHVAGTIGAVGNNGIGVAGVNWNVRLAPLRACYPDAFFSGSCDDAAVADAFAYAGQEGLKVVNGSFGGPGGASPPQAYVDAIAGAPNTLFVFSAGNSTSNNDSTPNYPCNITLSNVICVAATDQNDALASFSNYGSTSVDLGAPGKSIESTVPKNFGLQDTFTTNDFPTRWTIGGTNPIWTQTQACDATNLCGPVMEGQASPIGSTDSWARTTAGSSLTALEPVPASVSHQAEPSDGHLGRPGID